MKSGTAGQLFLVSYLVAIGFACDAEALQPCGPLSRWHIVHPLTNQVLGVVGGSLDDGAHVTLWPRDDTPNQVWHCKLTFLGAVILENEGSGKILGTRGISENLGERFQRFTSRAVQVSPSETGAVWLLRDVSHNPMNVLVELLDLSTNVRTIPMVVESIIPGSRVFGDREGYFEWKLEDAAAYNPPSGGPTVSLPPLARIYGRWNSNIGLVYEIDQNQNEFEWRENLGGRGQGSITSPTKLTTTWTDARGAHFSAQGTITQVRDGHPVEITWDNGLVFRKQ